MLVCVCVINHVGEWECARLTHCCVYVCVYLLGGCGVWTVPTVARSVCLTWTVRRCWWKIDRRACFVASAKRLPTPLQRAMRHEVCVCVCVCVCVSSLPLLLSLLLLSCSLWLVLFAQALLWVVVAALSKCRNVTINSRSLCMLSFFYFYFIFFFFSFEIVVCIWMIIFILFCFFLKKRETVGSLKPAKVIELAFEVLKVSFFLKNKYKQTINLSLFVL